MSIVLLARNEYALPPLPNPRSAATKHEARPRVFGAFFLDNGQCVVSFGESVNIAAVVASDFSRSSVTTTHHDLYLILNLVNREAKR